MLAAALAVTALGLTAGVLTASPAHATPPGVTTEILGSGTTGWHAHPGPVLVIVTTGSVTKYSAQDCTAHTYTAGQAFVEHGPTDENLVRNDGSVPAETLVTFITPPGAPIHHDSPPGRNP